MVVYRRVYKDLFGEPMTVSLPEVKIPVEYYRRGNPTDPISSDDHMYIVQITFSNRLMFIPADFTILESAQSIVHQLDFVDKSEFFLYIDGVCFVPSASKESVIDLESKEASLVKSLVNWLSQ